MNIEQRMATPIPKFADCGQDMTTYEVLRLEQLLLDFGQRDSPSPPVPVTRPPLTRKRPQSCNEGVDDADKKDQGYSGGRKKIGTNLAASHHGLMIGFLRLVRRNHQLP